MAVPIKNGGQPPKKQTNTRAELVPNRPDMGILKAQADKAKRDSIALTYKKK